MTSNPDFGQETTGTEAAQALRGSIKAKTVIITGVGPTSIGASTAFAIASQEPATLILASRTASKVKEVAAQIGQKYPSVTVHEVSLDLASLDSVKAAAAVIDTLVNTVDVLINNAGVCHFGRDAVHTPGDTFVDLQFMTNHLGPFLFTCLLLPKLRAAVNSNGANVGAVRIINVSSHGHRLSPVRFHDYQIYHYVYDGVPDSQKPPQGLPEGLLKLVDGYPVFIGYGQSKTANILFATELTRRLKARGEEGIIALSVHPGTIKTELSRSLDEDAIKTIDNTAPAGQWKTLDQGAATTIVAAFDPKLSELDVGVGVVGYMSDCQLGDQFVAEHAKDPENAYMLFQDSERMLGVSTGL